jgi:hypothetical protein
MIFSRHDEADRITYSVFRLAARRTFPSSRAPRYGSAPVREKRVGLSRSPGHRGYGHFKRWHCFLERRWRGRPHLSCDRKVHPAALAAPTQPSCDRDGRLLAWWPTFHRGVPRFGTRIPIPIWRVLHSHVVGIPARDHDVSQRWQTMRLGMQSTTTMMPV